MLVFRCFLRAYWGLFAKFLGSNRPLLEERGEDIAKHRSYGAFRLRVSADRLFG